MKESIPIKEAKNLAKEYHLTHVIIYGFDQNNNVQHVVTYGKSLDQCDQAAKLGNMMKEGLGFPKSLCKDEPSRITKLKTRIKELEKEILSLSRPITPRDATCGCGGE